MRISMALLLLTALAMQAQQAPVWESPNCSERMRIEVLSSNAEVFNGIAMVPLSAMKNTQPSFPGTLLIAAEDGMPSARWRRKCIRSATKALERELK